MKELELVVLGAFLRLGRRPELQQLNEGGFAAAEFVRAGELLSDASEASLAKISTKISSTFEGVRDAQRLRAALSVKLTLSLNVALSSADGDNLVLPVEDGVEEVNEFL